MTVTSRAKPAGIRPTRSNLRFNPRLRHWVLKATVQKALSVLPGGQTGNRVLQRYLTRSLEMTDQIFELTLSRCRKHFENYLAIGRRPRTGFSVVELGTGWYPVIPVGMYLCGASQTWTFDIRPLLSCETARVTLQMYSRYAQRGVLAALLPGVEEDKVQFLLNLAERANGSSASEILRPMQIHPVVGDAGNTGLRTGSIDLLLSNTTLQYVSARVIAGIFAEFRRLAAPGAVMSNYIYTGDDFALFDRSITSYNFLKFSDAGWRLISGAVHSPNRLRLSDYRRLHASERWTIRAEDNIQGSRDDLRRVRLAEKFRHCSEEDLLTLETWLISESNLI